MLFAVSRRGSFLIMPGPFSGRQIKAEIKGFLLVYRLFLYKHWFLPNFELKDFPEYTVTPCRFVTYDIFEKEARYLLPETFLPVCFQIIHWGWSTAKKMCEIL